METNCQSELWLSFNFCIKRKHTSQAVTIQTKNWMLSKIDFICSHIHSHTCINDPYYIHSLCDVEILTSFLRLQTFPFWYNRQKVRLLSLYFIIKHRLTNKKVDIYGFITEIQKMKYWKYLRQYAFIIYSLYWRSNHFDVNRFSMAFLF